MPDELKAICDGSFDVVPAVKLLALRLVQLEQDVARLVVTAPVEDAEPPAVPKRAPSKKGT